MSMYLINDIATICRLKRQWKSSKNYSGKVVKIAGNNCNFGSHWLLAVNHCNQCSDWLQLVNHCQMCRYYLQLSAVKNHMQWITTIQNRVQSFNCTFTALSLQRFAVYMHEMWKATLTAIWKWGVSKQGILKSPVSHVLNFLAWIKLIFDTADCT